MATTEQFSLRWNNFHSNLTSGFHDLLEAADMVDVTLAVEGQFLQAHKIVLSICSPYFKQMFKINPCQHPIVILKDITHDNLKDILEFMYLGEVNVMRENLPSFLRTAELLQVKGLTGDDSQSESSPKREEKAALTDDEPEYNQLIESDGVNFTSSPKPPIKRQRSPMYTPTLKKSKSESKSVKENCNENERNELLPNIKSEMSLECDDKDQINKLYPEGVFNSDANPHENARCDACGKWMRKSSIRRHKLDVHLPTQQLPCDLCHKLFKTPNSLTTHLITIHKQFKSNKKFRSKSTELVYDVVMYTVDEKGHAYCPYCFKKFVNRYNLKVHIRDKHDTSASNLDCLICGKTMRNRSCLRVHMYHHRKQEQKMNSSSTP